MLAAGKCYHGKNTEFTIRIPKYKANQLQFMSTSADSPSLQKASQSATVIRAIDAFSGWTVDLGENETHACLDHDNS